MVAALLQTDPLTTHMLNAESTRLPAQAEAEPASQDDKLTLGNFSIDEYQPVKVIVIGAGFSGILAGIRSVSYIVADEVACIDQRIRFSQKIPNIDLTIYEKSAGVGGTWYNNRYP